MNDKLQTQQKMLSSWKGIMEVLQKEMITHEDFLKAFKEVITLVTKIERQLISKVDKKMSDDLSRFKEMRSEMERAIEETRNASNTTFTQIKQRAMESIAAMFAKMDIQKKMDGMYREHEEMMTKMDSKMSEMKAVDIPAEETAEETRDLLESIKDEDEKLKISAIGHLQEELDKLKKSIDGNGGHAVFASQRGAVRAYDLSASLNGVLKTFTLPAFWRVISVHTSSVPNILRETTDYTTDASVPSITFTDEISATSTLATGQSLIIVYAEG